MIIIREAELSDAKRLLEIYSYYVTDTAVSYEYDPPSLEEFTERMKKAKKAFTYLVALDEGKIVGYCYALPFHERKAYEKCVETSIYLDKNYKGQGIGRMLYDEIQEELKNRGIKNIYACVAYPAAEDEYLTKDSYLFHQKMGFTECGHLRECGYKFDRWYDMTYLEKII